MVPGPSGVARGAVGWRPTHKRGAAVLPARRSARRTLLETALREQMLARAEVLVNTLVSWAHDHPEADGLLEELTGVAVGAETLRTHAERLGTELEGYQHARMAHVQAEQAPPPDASAPAPGQLVVETDGVMVRYRDRHLDGVPIEGDWHEVKLGLAGGWQDGHLRQPSYVAAREPAAAFARRLGTEAARRGALDVVAWQP